MRRKCPGNGADLQYFQPGVIFHSGRGCQYISAAYAALAGDCQVTLSVGRTGQCWDNALAESFFSSLKGEFINTRAWFTRVGAKRAIVEYIGWYNGTRLHSSLHSDTAAPPNLKTTTTKPSGK
jgi:transposase InsO family protein